MVNPLETLKRNKLSSFIFNNKEIKVDENIVKNLLKVRDNEAYKGDFGQVLVIAGSRGYSGAAFLTAQAKLSQLRPVPWY